MKIEYRIIMTATFANETDRDTWAAKMKTSFVNAKTTSPAFLAAHLTKDDYQIPGRDTETL